MADFPDLSIDPERPLKEEREDSTIRSNQEGGYETTRQRFTRIRRKWGVNYKLMPQADKDLLTAFLETVGGGADLFNWTHPITSEAVVVRFQKPPSFDNVEFGAVQYYDVTFTLNEV